METPVFIARVFGIFYLVVGAGMIFNRKFYQKFMADYSKNTTLVFFTGMFTLIVGTVILLFHNLWMTNWTVIITIIGWCALVKGVWIIIFPNTVLKIMQVYQQNESLLMVHSIAALIFGAVLTFFGFFI